MKKKITFSIITTVLNNEKFIKKNMLSVKNQTFKNYEHIIIDGGSKDQTLKIINQNKSKKNITIRKKDKNLWEGINNGIKFSKGEIICILNSDDYFFPNALKIINSYFQKNDNLGYIFGAVKKDNRILYRLEKEKIYYKFNVYPSHSVSFFIKKNIQNKIGLYNEDYNFCSDYDFFYKLFKSKKIIGTNTKKNEIIGFFRSGGISENISHFKKILIEFKIRFHNGQNFFFLIILFILTILNIVKNSIFKFLNLKK